MSQASALEDPSPEPRSPAATLFNRPAEPTTTPLEPVEVTVDWLTPTVERADAVVSAPSAVWQSAGAVSFLPGDLHPQGGWNNRFAWLIACTPFVGVLAATVLIVLSIGETAFWAIPIALLPAGWSLFFAFKDRAIQVDRGLARPTSPWWALLGIVLFLGLRALRIRSEGGRSAAPFWVYLGNAVISAMLILVIAGIAAASIAASSLTTTQNAAASGALVRDVVVAVQTDLVVAGALEPWVITCPNTVPATAGSSFTCAAVDDLGVASATVDVRVIDDVGGFRYQLVPNG